MLVEEELGRLSPEKDAALTIGVFDGVHLGHKYLISRLTGHARQHNLQSVVVTFRQHPQEMLSPQARQPYLTTLARRAGLIKDEGVDGVIFLSFTRELADLSPRQFTDLLKKYLRMRALVVGPDFALGRNREGNAEVLSELGKDMDFAVTVVPPFTVNGEVISSTVVRRALAGGDMEQVNNLIGRYFSVSGRVVTGAHRGIGFPTANLEVAPEQALPPHGVYASRAYIDNQPGKSVTNIGQQPTFGNNRRTVEVHILDYQGNLYQHELAIEIIERLRDEKKFNNPEELRQQITKDIEKVRNILVR